MTKGTYKTIGILLLILGSTFLLWFYFFENKLNKSASVFGFLVIALGSRFMRISNNSDKTFSNHKL